ncbi:putative alcohol dehydrogenase protein [Botrytis cinerea BcDW1]|nr:putative alcohol dehydrogenase protein [Botrytis cinerea BcDW1]
MNTITTLPTTLKNKAQALISTMSLPKTYKAAVFEKANAPFVIKDVELTQPSANEVLVKVIACGVCHSDAFVQSGGFGNGFPIVPGHEVIGTVAAVGEGVQKWKVGERVGGPWHGGHDGTCKQCNRGQFQMCSNGAVNGVTRDGGYAEYVHLRSEAVVRIPEDVDPYEYAPILCAGITVFNSMRKLQITPGEVVAIQGLGGLGHLAVQYAAKMGYKVVAISGGDKKRDFAHKLGAHEYIDTSKDDPVKKLTEMGGAALIVCTAPNPKSISPLTGGLGAGGKLLILAPCGGVEINSIDLITKMASVSGFPSGHALDCEEAIEFTKLHTVDCMIEKFPLSDVQKAYDHMLSGDVRFRSVLVMDQ